MTGQSVPRTGASMLKQQALLSLANSKSSHFWIRHPSGLWLLVAAETIHAADRSEARVHHIDSALTSEIWLGRGALNVNIVGDYGQFANVHLFDLATDARIGS